jgi:drug/metabolite transporter (DMT)-like permease
MALTGILIYNVCFFLGLRTVPPGRASLIVATNPALMLLAAALLYGEKLTLRRIGAIALSMAGAALVLTQGDWERLFNGGLGLGDLIILGCTLGWTAYTLIGRRAMRDLHPLHATAWSTFAGALGIVLLDAATSRGGGPWAFSWQVWAAFAFLGLLGTTVAFVWYLDGVGKLGPARATVFLNLVPVASVLLSALVTGEQLTAATAIAAVMVLAGISLSRR